MLRMRNINMLLVAQHQYVVGMTNKRNDAFVFNGILLLSHLWYSYSELRPIINFTIETECCELRCLNTTFSVK